MFVEPLLISLGLVDPKSSHVFQLNMSNTKSEKLIVNVEILAGSDVALNWLTFKQTSFEIAAGAQDSIDCEINIPEFAMAGGYYYVLAVKVPSQDDSPISFSSAVTITILFTVKGLLLQGNFPSGEASSSQTAWLLFSNFEESNKTVYSRVSILEGSNIVYESWGENTTLMAHNETNLSYKKIWKFHIDTSEWSGNYVAFFEVFFYEHTTSQEVIKLNLQKLFVVGYYKGVVHTRVAEASQAFEPIKITLSIINQGTLPLTVQIDAYLEENTSKTCFGSYQNYYVTAQPNTLKEEELVFIPTIEGNFSLHLTYQYTDKKEEQVYQLSIAGFADFLTSTSTQALPLQEFLNKPFIKGIPITTPLNVIVFFIGLIIGFITKTVSNRVIFADSEAKKRKAKKIREGCLLAWQINRTDGTDLYSRTYSVMRPQDDSLKMDHVLRTLATFLREKMAIINSSEIQQIVLDKEEIISIRGKFIQIVFILRKSVNNDEMYRLQRELLEYIEKEAQVRLEEGLVDHEMLADVWLYYEDKVQPYIAATQ